MDSDSLNRSLERLRKKVDDWLLAGSTKGSRARRELIGKIMKVLFFPLVLGTLSVALVLSRMGTELGVNAPAPHKLLGSAGEFNEPSEVDTLTLPGTDSSLLEGIGVETEPKLPEVKDPQVGGTDEAIKGAEEQKPEEVPQVVVVTATPTKAAPIATAVAESTATPKPTATATYTSTPKPTVVPPTAVPTKVKAVPTKAKAVPTKAEVVPTKAKAEPTKAKPEVKKAAVTNKGINRGIVFPARFQSGRSVPILSTEADYSAIVKLLNNCKGEIHITGHSDGVGREDINRKLAFKRARQVRDLLVKKGFKARKEQMVVSSMGSKEPIASDSTLQGRITNRRVEISCK